MMQRMSYLHPVSALPIIHYVAMKVQEVMDLRLIVRGRLAGLSAEVLEAHVLEVTSWKSQFAPALTLGFQLAGLSDLYNPEGEDELHSTLRSLLNNKSVGIMVVDSAVMSTPPDRLRISCRRPSPPRCSASVRRKTPPCEIPFARP